MAKVEKIDFKKTQKGATYKNITLDEAVLGKKYFNIFSFHTRYDDVEVGRSFAEEEFKKNGDFLELIDPDAGLKRPTGGRGGFSAPAVAMAQENKAQHIKEAQDNKDHAIRLSGAMNHAVTIMSTFGDKESTPAEIKEKIINWRNWFLENWEVEKSGEIPF